MSDKEILSEMLVRAKVDFDSFGDRIEIPGDNACAVFVFGDSEELDHVEAESK